MLPVRKVMGSHPALVNHKKKSSYVKKTTYEVSMGDEPDLVGDFAAGDPWTI